MSTSTTVHPLRPRRPLAPPRRPDPDPPTPAALPIPVPPLRPPRPAADLPGGAAVGQAGGRRPDGTGGRSRRSERGQATAEYALVVLAAAALAGLLLAWAAGTDGIGRLFDAVMDSLIDRTT